MKAQANSKPKVLIVAHPDDYELLHHTLAADYQVFRQVSKDVLDILAIEENVAVLIFDWHMLLSNGTQLLNLMTTKYPYIVQIVLTSSVDAELVAANKAGSVFKYVIRPGNPEEIKALVRQALDTHIILKARTQKLCQTLRRESLLNTVTNTIRSAPDYRQILQTIVDTVGQMLEASYCILRPFQDNRIIEESFIYQMRSGGDTVPLHSCSLNLHPSVLNQTVWETREVLVIDDVKVDERIQGSNPECSSLLQLIRQPTFALV